jgi:hypothetical protein
MKRRVGKTEEVWVWQLEPLIVSKRKDVISNTGISK